MMEKFYKLIFDITCFYIFTAFFFYLIFRAETDMAAYGVLLFTVLLQVVFERMVAMNRMKWIVLVLPFICLVKESSVVEKVQILIPWVYMVIVIVREQYGLYYDEFKLRFKGMTASLLIPLIAFCYTEDMELGKAAFMQMIPFLFVFLTSGVLLMQNLRFGTDGKGRKEFERHQIGQMVGFFLFCILVTTGRIIQLLNEYVFMPLIKAVLVGAMGLLYKIYETLMLPPEHYAAVENSFAERYGPEPSIVPTMAPEIIVPDEVVASNPELAKIELSPDFIIVSLAVIMAIILICVLCGARKSKSGEAVVEDERETLDEIEVPEKKGKKHSLRPDIVIRYYYLKFMELAESKETKVRRSDTTEEIREKFLAKKPENQEESKEITTLYQKVRYTENIVTKEDAVKMKSLMKRVSR